MLSSSVSGLDPDAKGYINALVAAGATVSGTQRNAINTFIKAEKAASRWTLHKRFFLPIWGVAAANAIDMVSRVSSTFAGGVTHAAGYVQSDGSTGSLLLDSNLVSLGVSHTSYALGGLCYVAPSLTGRNIVSSFTGPEAMLDVLHNTATLISTRGGSRADANALVALAPANFADHRGVILSSYDGASRFLKIRRSGGITSATGSATAVGATPTAVPRCMADSRNLSHSDAGYGSFYISAGMSSANADSFITAIETLWETCTGLTLP